MKEYFGILKTCPLFSGVAEGELQAMLQCLGARELAFDREQTIFREGDSVGFVGVVLQGAVRIIRTDFYGNQTIVGQMEPGELFGEAFSCAGVDRLPVTVTAAMSSRVLLLELRRVLTVCSKACLFHSRIVSNLVQVLAQKNLQLHLRMDVASRRRTRDKLMAYLQGQAKLCGSAEFTIPFDRQALADYLGVERSAMSAELSRMQKDGLLETRRSHFRLLGAKPFAQEE